MQPLVRALLPALLVLAVQSATARDAPLENPSSIGDINEAIASIR